MDRDKRKQQEAQEKFFLEQSKIEANQLCADCGTRGPKWSSWNIGVFLCIRCGGVHRKLGTHISKVKSTTLDTWTPEQMDSIRSKGNAKANLLFNPNGVALPRNPSDRDLETYIRDKYERKVFMSGTNRATGPPPSASSDPSKWTSSLAQLHEMGFVYDVFNIRALEQCKGNLQAAIEAIIAMGPPPAGSHQPPPTAARPVALDSASVMRGAKVSFDLNAPAMRQLKAMGFTDEHTNAAALQKAEGSLDQALVLLTDRKSELDAYKTQHAPATKFDQNQYTQQFLSAQQPHHQHVTQEQKPASPKKNELLDLFGDGDPFSGPGPMQQPITAFSNINPSMQQSNPAFNNNTSSFMAPPQPSSSNPFNPFANPTSLPSTFSDPRSVADTSNPFGDFATAPSAVPVQQKSAASDIMSLYGKPSPQQQPFNLQQMPSQSFNQSPFNQLTPMQPFNQQSSMQPFIQQQTQSLNQQPSSMQSFNQQQQTQSLNQQATVLPFNQQQTSSFTQPQASPFNQQQLTGLGGMQMSGTFSTNMNQTTLGIPMQTGMMPNTMGMQPSPMGSTQFHPYQGGGMNASASSAGLNNNYTMPHNPMQQPKALSGSFGTYQSPQLATPSIAGGAGASPDPFAGLGNVNMFNTAAPPKPANSNPFL